MEDTFLNVFFVVVSLLLSKEHNVFHEQDDDIIGSMQDREHVLLQEDVKLEEQSVVMELPRSDQEVSQSPHKLPGKEGDTSDVQQTMPNVRTTVLHEGQMSTVGDKNDFRQQTFAPDDQDVSVGKWKLHMSNTRQASVHQSGSDVDQNVSQGDEELSEKPKNGQIDTHHESQTDQTSFMSQEDTYTWYLWKTFSLISLIRFLKWILKSNAKPQAFMFLNGKTVPISMNDVCAKVSHLDYKTITNFYDQCVHVSPSNTWQICEFIEGFVNDLMETVSIKNPDMKIEEFVGVGSLYEQWASRKNIVCDIHIPIIPPKPYTFEFKLMRDGASSSITLYSTVKMVKDTSVNGCLCSSNLDDDMLCLLHLDNNVKEDYINATLCQENSSYLSKKHVVKWFRNAIRKAWEEISHKYDFELIWRNRDGPGSLKVRFRSGKSILFNITPVVQFQDSQAHLMSKLPSTENMSDTHWPVCLTRYEDGLLQHLTKTLPNNCHIHFLQILSFLHKHQISLTGKCGLTSYHLKNTLLNILLVDKHSTWQPEQIPQRLYDVLTFLQQRLRDKVLKHALVGNPLIPGDFRFPKEFREGKPLNLFMSLLSNEELYIKTKRHLEEMIRNLPVLMYEYSKK